MVEPAQTYREMLETLKVQGCCPEPKPRLVLNRSGKPITATCQRCLKPLPLDGQREAVPPGAQYVRDYPFWGYE